MLFTLHPDYLPIRADEITPDRLQLYEAFTGNIGTTIRAEYLPRTMIPRPYTGLAADRSSGGALYARSSHAAKRLALNLNATR